VRDSDDDSDVMVFDSDTTTRLNARAGAGDAIQESWVVLQSLVEPVVLAGEANENACRASVTSDDNLLGRRLAQKTCFIAVFRAVRAIRRSGA
jgi:hypothetical protein